MTFDDMNRDLHKLANEFPELLYGSYHQEANRVGQQCTILTTEHGYSYCFCSMRAAVANTPSRWYFFDSHGHRGFPPPASAAYVVQGVYGPLGKSPIDPRKEWTGKPLPGAFWPVPVAPRPVNHPKPRQHYKPSHAARTVTGASAARNHDHFSTFFSASSVLRTTGRP